MRLPPIARIAFSATALVALASSVALAIPEGPSASADGAARPAPQASFAYGRPMDDHGPDLEFGDLSVFDTITEIGQAQSPDVPFCDHRADLLSVLDHDFAESPRAQRPLEGQRSVELWASDIMGTWTAVYTRADGVACVVSSGIGWERGHDAIALLQDEGLLPRG